MVRRDHFDGRHNGERSSESIEQDVRRTRDEMDRTLDELGRRLEPRRLAQDLWETVRERIPGGPDAADAARNAGAGMVRQIANHPVPAAIIGAGLLWFIVEESRGRESRERGWGGWSRDLSHKTQSAAGATGHALSDAAQNVGRHMSQFGRQSASSARQAAHMVQDRAQMMSRRASGVYERHPLSVGLAAMGVGLLAGVATPNTPIENRAMGASADRLRRRTGEMAQEKAAEVIETATDAVSGAPDDSTGAARQSGHESEV